MKDQPKLGCPLWTSALDVAIFYKHHEAINLLVVAGVGCRVYIGTYCRAGICRLQNILTYQTSPGGGFPRAVPKQVLVLESVLEHVPE